MIGGSYLSNSPKCTSVVQCSVAAKAPIDQPPRVIAIDGFPISSYLLTMSGTVNELLELTISTFDPNQFDQVGFDQPQLVECVGARFSALVTKARFLFISGLHRVQPL